LGLGFCASHLKNITFSDLGIDEMQVVHVWAGLSCLSYFLVLSWVVLAGSSKARVLQTLVYSEVWLVGAGRECRGRDWPAGA
jgi:hypothetical protein